MKLLTVTTEFNPFHFGHKKILSEAKRLTDSDATICLMSGNFVQRGEPAVFDKITRAKCAILSGANLVLEIPTVYACADAETFSTYATKAADAINADYLLFGCESRDMKTLTQIADVLADEPEDFRIVLHQKLDEGNSFAVAREYALISILGDQVSSALKSPNNILAIEYLKAIKRFNLNISPVSLTRVETEPLFSATSIRKMLVEDVDAYKKLPEETLPALDDYFASGRSVISINDFSSAFSVCIRQIDESADLPYIEPGLINLMKKNSHMLTSGNVDSFIEACCGKRYTKARIRRILTCILLGINSNDITSCHDIKPNYIRVLAADKVGFKALNQIRETTDILLSERMLDLLDAAKSADDKSAYNELCKTVTATDIYVTAHKNPEHAALGSEFTSGSYFKK